MAKAAGWKRRYTLGLVAIAAGTWIWTGLPNFVPAGTASGPVAEVFAEAMRDRSPDRLLQHARAVPETMICVVSVQGWFRYGVERGGARAASVPNYALNENIWAFILVRPEGPAEFVTLRSAQIYPKHSLDCLHAEAADITFSEASTSGPTVGYLAVAPLRR